MRITGLLAGIRWVFCDWRLTSSRIYAMTDDEIEAHFVEEADPHVNELGVKGLGEIALVGLAPAIANAVFHATGKRVRTLPIRIEDVLTA